MPRLDYKTCKECDRHVSECGTLSHNRLCERCGNERRAANALAISAKSGEMYAHQIRRQFMVARRALLDLERASA